MKLDIYGKVVVLTGCNGQLGESFANYLLNSGAKVFGIDLKPSSQIQNPNFIYFSSDITKTESLKKALLKCVEVFSYPTVLINNAAIDTPPGSNSNDTGPFEDFSDDTLTKVIDVNIKGLVNCCKVFGKSMSENKDGSIINISSIYGLVSPDQSIYDYKRKNGNIFYKPISYSATKSAIFNITRYLAVYWAKKNIRVNTLTFAGVFNNQDKEFLQNYCDRIPIGRMANPEDYHGAIHFLCSDMSKYMTGSNLIIDGGWTAI